jgi:TolB-like protein
MKSTWQLRVAALAAILLQSGAPLRAGDDDDKKAGPVCPVAVFPFQERGTEVKGFASKVTDLLFAQLVAKPELFLVDREDLKKVLDEQELNQSGLVNPAEATKVGHLTGAKILVTGSVLQVDAQLYVVAKIIGTETSRVLGASVKGKIQDPLDGLVKDLASEVAKTLAVRASELVAKPISREDRIAALRDKIGKGKVPTVMITVSERHVGKVTIDPAAQSELALICRQLGFEVIDPSEGNRKEAGVIVTGEGFSEFATRHGNLASVKARLEVKAVDRTSGRVIAVDRHTSIAVDLTEQIAGKSALQDAAANIAEQLLPKLVKSDSDKQPDKIKKKTKENI